MAELNEQTAVLLFWRRFEALLTFPPMPWQEALFLRFLSEELPSGCDIPTGLGKTAVMAIWLLARAAGASLPRRLIYVVDRRAVVDQATEVAQQIRSRLESDDQLRQIIGLRNGRSLPISTLRGQHVDNQEWLEDPVSPAIIIGTVDMVGSRLLFEGYGVSRKMRPYHAGLLGADSMVLLDEAHLVPPFERLLAAIDQGASTFGPRGADHQALIPRFKLLTLSATGRGSTERCHGLTAKDLEHEEVKKRLGAKKRLTIIPPPEVSKDWKLAGALAAEAWKLSDNGKKPIRCIVFCNKRKVAEQTLKEIQRIAKGDKKASQAKVNIDSELFVGSRRVFEREQAAQRLRTLGFIAGTSTAPEKPTFLVATSAAEVGVDLDGDHMVSDLVPWERMVQRLGRVNRLGNREASAIVVVREPVPKPKNNIVKKALLKDATDWNKKEIEAVAKYQAEVESARKWIRPLERLPVNEGSIDASPGAIRELKSQAENDNALAQILLQASTPAPLYPALTLPLVDAWSMTSLKEHTGRPIVDPWLRGWTDDRPQTTVVWRRFLPVRRGGRVNDKEIEAFFEAAPPHTSEKLETETYQVFEWLKALGNERAPEAVRNVRIAEDQERVSDDDDNDDDNNDDDDDETDLEDQEVISDMDSLVVDDDAADEGRVDAADTIPEREIVAFVLSPAGDLHKCLRLRELALLSNKKADKRRKAGLERLLQGATIVVDRRLAGLAETGLLDSDVGTPPRSSDDGEAWVVNHSDADIVSEESFSPIVRFRVRSVQAGTEAVTDRNWRERYRFATTLSAEGTPISWLVIDKWRHDAATEDDRAHSRPQLLEDHTKMVEMRVMEMARELNVPEPYLSVLSAAARLHDDGKKAVRWQRAFRADIDGIYGKTAGPVSLSLLDGYRHELGSLPAAAVNPEIVKMPDDLRDLTLHLIAAHHGFARPVIETSGCEEPPSKLEKMAGEIALRFARLQKDWGPWGLAWWEALLRAADQQASRDNDERQEQT